VGRKQSQGNRAYLCAPTEGSAGRHSNVAPPSATGECPLMDLRNGSFTARFNTDGSASHPPSQIVGEALLKRCLFSTGMSLPHQRWMTFSIGRSVSDRKHGRLDSCAPLHRLDRARSPHRLLRRDPLTLPTVVFFLNQ
jgi:hypothetical protein